MISNEVNSAAPIVMMNRIGLNGFGDISVAIVKANIMAKIEIAARYTIAIMLSPNPALSRLIPRKPK